MSTNDKCRPVLMRDGKYDKSNWRWFSFDKRDGSDETFKVDVDMHTGCIEFHGTVTFFDVESALGQIRAYVGGDLKQAQIRIANKKNQVKGKKQK
jgi:hypothetical protein